MAVVNVPLKTLDVLIESGHSMDSFGKEQGANPEIAKDLLLQLEYRQDSTLNII
jgi:hypothetical protein